MMKERVQALRLPEPAKGRTSSRGPWGVVVVVVGLFLWQSYVTRSRSNAPNAEPTTPSDSPVAAQSSSTAPLEPSGKRASDPNVALDDKGHLVPAHQILVSPKVSGMILKLNIAEGLRVKKGEELARIESVEYEAERDRAVANLLRAEAARDRALARQSEAEAGFRPLEKVQADAEHEEATAELARLDEEHKRNQALRAKDALSIFDFQQSEARLLAAKQRVRRLDAARNLMIEGERGERRSMAKSDLAQAEAEVKQAQADLRKAEWRLENCIIRAPITGMILKKNAEEGNIVNPVAFNGSFSLCDMADLSDLEVDLSISERDISEIFVGQRCEIRADAYRDRVYQGVVDRLMPIADRAKASIPVRVKVKNVPPEEEGVYLKPEMAVSVTFYKRTATQPEQEAGPNKSFNPQP